MSYFVQNNGSESHRSRNLSVIEEQSRLVKIGSEISISKKYPLAEDLR